MILTTLHNRVKQDGLDHSLDATVRLGSHKLVEGEKNDSRNTLRPWVLRTKSFVVLG